MEIFIAEQIKAPKAAAVIKKTGWLDQSIQQPFSCAVIIWMKGFLFHQQRYIILSCLHRLLRATLSIIRSDDFDFPEDGAVFEITDEEGVVLFSGAIGKDGLLSAVLPLGTNIVTAISAPEDYIIDDAQRRCF